MYSRLRICALSHGVACERSLRVELLALHRLHVELRMLALRRPHSLMVLIKMLYDINAMHIISRRRLMRLLRPQIVLVACLQVNFYVHTGIMWLWEIFLSLIRRFALILLVLAHCK